MIITPAYRKFHDALEEVHSLVADATESIPADVLAEMVDTLNGLTHLNAEDKATMLLDDDKVMLDWLVEVLSPSAEFDRSVRILEDLASYPVDATLFEQQVREFAHSVVFGDTYGFDGHSEFGTATMDFHLRGLEMVHETEMTPRAFRDLENSLEAFDIYLSRYPDIGINPFDSGTITDDYIRLSRLVKGA